MNAITSEASDDYPIVARLNANWRVIVCSGGIQWVLQHGGRAKNHGHMRWRSRSFCRTREALIRVSRQHCGMMDAAAVSILEALPATVEAVAEVPA